VIRIEPKSFRNALGQFATGVTVVTTRGPLGPVGLTVNSFASVSLDPPMVLWSLRARSINHTVFFECDYFSVNVLAEDQERLSHRFATPLEDKFDGVAIKVGLGDAPIIEGAAAVFECARHANYFGGDHTIFVGRVKRFAHRHDVLPLVFCRGIYLTRSLR
jgi:flavin reductase (DIM6/NTAB) family NADH-FMN oxidoreductase RutF